MANHHPSIKWGQKKDHILLTVAVQDIDKPDINIESTKFHFKGQQNKGVAYDTTLEFFDEVDPQTSKFRKVSQNHWEFMLKKKDASTPFWKRLTKSNEKCNWITVDWNHFSGDGDDDEEEEPGMPDGKNWGDLDGMFKQMGAGMGGPSSTDLNDLEGEADSDDEPMPDLEETPKDTEEEKK